MIVLPADHVVKDKGHFLNILGDAVTAPSQVTVVSKRESKKVNTSFNPFLAILR